MDWRQWTGGLDLEAWAALDIDSIIIALVLIAGSAGIGWYIGHRAGKPLSRRLQHLGGATQISSASAVAALVRYSIIALLLLVVGNAAPLGEVARVVMASALGVAVGFLVLRLLSVSRLGFAVAALLAVIAGVAATAATLGGMRPLMESLEGVGFSIGARRLSLLSLINAVVIVALLYVLARVANHVLSYVIGRASMLDISQRALAQKVAGIAVIAAAVLFGVDLLGIDLTALTVFSGAFGLAVGFGLQKTFGNLIAGLILLMDRSVKPGDVIVVGDTFGAISKIGVRAVSVVTRDGKEHLIPNENLMTEPVENWSYSNRNVRVHIPVGVAYSSDLALAQRLLIEAAASSKRVLAEPAPSVWLKGFGDSSVDHDVLVWIGDPELGVGNVRSEILNRVWTLFAEHGIEIPFPQRDIHIRDMPSAPLSAARETPREPMAGMEPGKDDQPG